MPIWFLYCTLTMLPFTSAKTYGLPDPSYDKLHKIFQSYGLNHISISMDYATNALKNSPLVKKITIKEENAGLHFIV